MQGIGSIEVLGSTLMCKDGRQLSPCVRKTTHCNAEIFISIA